MGGGAAVGVASAQPQPVAPQPVASSPALPEAATDTSSRAPVDSADHPNNVPYRTDRSLLYHTLALPAYTLEAITWPLGVGVRYLENNFPQIFLPKPVTKGVRPLVELGGPNGVEIGALLFHHDLWGAGHDARLSGEIAAQESWDLEFRYLVPAPTGPASTLEVFAEYGINNRRRFFVGGNDADRETDEAQFYRRRLDLRTTLGYAPTDGFSGETGLQFEHVRTRPSDEDPRLGTRIVGQPGLGVLNLASVHTEAAWDRSRTTDHRGIHRRTGGTVLIGRVGYAQSVQDDRFRYLRLSGEVQQYVSVPFLPPMRRLALRARVEKAEPVFGGDAVPFYDLPGLGGQESLRGFVFDRYVDDGLLLVNAEYRYPIWDAFDAVVFVDAGQAFTRFEDLAADRFRWSYGGGVRALTGRKLGARFEVAYSDEGVRAILTVTPAFSARTAGD